MSKHAPADDPLCPVCGELLPPDDIADCCRACGWPLLPLTAS